MSALPPKADIAKRDHHVRFVPKADIGTVTLVTCSNSATIFKAGRGPGGFVRVSPQKWDHHQFALE
jgi:hypothetical protein